MIGLLKRRPPVPVPVASRSDIQTAYAWCLTLDQWDGLTEFERAECRRNVTTAPRFQS